MRQNVHIFSRFVRVIVKSEDTYIYWYSLYQLYLLYPSSLYLDCVGEKLSPEVPSLVSRGGKNIFSSVNLVVEGSRR